VVPLLLQSSGKILSAGGVVFSDGSAWEYGRGEAVLEAPQSYVRPADYGSAYCMMAPRELFVALGLFAAEYSPAWYDDTDAAFAVRAAGFEVYYTPFAEAVVLETQDLVITKGHMTKAQLLEANRNTFQRKWASVLSCHYLHDTVASQASSFCLRKDGLSLSLNSETYFLTIEEHL
jgi:GT2 family glycosyltransferase